MKDAWIFVTKIGHDLNCQYIIVNVSIMIDV